MLQGLRHLAAYLLLNCAFVGVQSNQTNTTCEIQGPCPGGRPLASNGCCPALGGEACGSDVGLDCDISLGYRCVAEEEGESGGTCQGPYNLKANSIGERRANLTWYDFKRVGYQHEYSLMMTTNTYKENDTEWNTYECGNAPYYQLLTLKPGTWYFIRIGVWDDPFNRIYANITETVMFKTQAVEYCEFDNEQFEVGEVVKEDCEEKCTCMETGIPYCIPRCPTGVDVPEEQEGCEIVRGNDCCKLELKCEGSSDGHCTVNGTVYFDGRSFEIGCMTCQCNNGKKTCAYPSRCSTVEASESCPTPQAIPVPGKCCPLWRCANGSCKRGQGDYSHGEKWRDEETCKFCTCSNGQVNCEDICEEPVIPANCSRPLRKRSPTGCCYVVECLPPAGACIYESKTYPRGDYFPNSRCELCVCKGNSSVECSPKCPPVRLPPPSFLCPHPNIRKDGCCKTLFCLDPDEELASIIRNLFGTSVSPHSVTLSYTIPTTGESKVTNAKYEVLYTDGNGDNSTGVWQRMAFTPREFHSEDEPLVSPTELLKKTDAIVVSQRVYVTVSGMEANTTYFMKIRIKQGDSSGETTSTTAPPTYAGAIAVKTLAEGEDITCSGTCRSEEVTMVPSASCPRPVLEQVDNACCPEWRCHPAENGCRYKRLILQDGEQVREGCEESCRCSRGNLTCSAICEPDGIPPRAGCSLKTLPDHCCRVWMCLPARKPVKSVSLNFGITFRGLCATPVGDFKSRFKTVFLNFLQDRVYVNKSSERRTVCDRMEAFITCPVSNPTTSRRKREVSDIKFDLRIVLNIGDFDSMTAAKQTLDKMATALVDVFNGTDVTITEGFTTYVTTGSISIIGPKYDCDPYYVLVGNTCVQAGVTQPPTSHIDLSLSPISVSTDSAILAWDSLTDSEIRYVTGLQIEYREEAYFDWNQTGRIDPHVTRHTLTQLQAARKYRARLVVLTNMSKVDRLPMTAVKFQTKAFDVFTSTIIVLKEVKVDDKSVSIRWSPFPANIIDVISAMEVTYKKMDMTSAKTLHQGLDLTASECKLTGLDPSTIYVAQINILFKNGTVTRSGSIHFVTRAKVSGSNDTIIMPLAVSAVVVVCVLAIVLITCWLWRRNRKRNSHETAFENKTFGIHIENDGKTLSARP